MAPIPPVAASPGACRRSRPQGRNSGSTAPRPRGGPRTSAGPWGLDPREPTFLAFRSRAARAPGWRESPVGEAPGCGGEAARTAGRASSPGKRRLLIVTHDNPDPDTIATGWVLLRLARRLSAHAGRSGLRRHHRPRREPGHARGPQGSAPAARGARPDLLRRHRPGRLPARHREQLAAARAPPHHRHRPPPDAEADPRGPLPRRAGGLRRQRDHRQRVPDRLGTAHRPPAGHRHLLRHQDRDEEPRARGLPRRHQGLLPASSRWWTTTPSRASSTRRSRAPTSP